MKITPAMRTRRDLPVQMQSIVYRGLKCNYKTRMHSSMMRTARFSGRHWCQYRVLHSGGLHRVVGDRDSHRHIDTPPPPPPEQLLVVTRSPRIVMTWIRILAATAWGICGMSFNHHDSSWGCLRRLRLVWLDIALGDIKHAFVLLKGSLCMLKNSTGDKETYSLQSKNVCPFVVCRYNHHHFSEITNPHAAAIRMPLDRHTI